MQSRFTAAVVGLSLGGCLILATSPIFAEADQQQDEKMAQAGDNKGKGAVSPRAAPRTAGSNRAAPRAAGPGRAGPRTAAPRRAAPNRVAPRTAAPRRARPRTAGPRRTGPQKAVPRRVAPSRTAPRTVVPKTDGPRTTSPSTVAPRKISSRGLRSLPTRGAGRTMIHGRNFSGWRSGYRARHGSRWRTFGALSALSVLVIGSSIYYPYAYISAPQPYCDGLTEDGCQLAWQEVMTIEGDTVYQCVAYCPWQ